MSNQVPGYDLPTDTIDYSFGPAEDDPENERDDGEDVAIASEERQHLVIQDPDPARFGIHVTPSTNVRQLLIPHGNDGVFANMSAKPEAGPVKEEHPPVSLRIESSKRYPNQFRLMMKRQQIMPHHIGIKPCTFLVLPMMSMLMDSPSATFLVSYGT